MTKTDWTSADYREASKRLAMGDILLLVSQVRSMLDFAANRIEADERAVCCCGNPSVIGVRHRTDGPCYWGENGVDYKPIAHPPAQPAQEQPGWKVPDYLIDWLKEKATHAPAPMVLCAPTMAMGDGWKAKTLLELLSPAPPKEN